MKKLLLGLLILNSILFSNEDSKMNELLYKGKILFEINKLYEISKLNIYRSEEYLCDFGVIKIDKKPFSMSFLINSKYSVELDNNLIKYFEENKLDIYKALESFFNININGNYCFPNPNLIYDNQKNKPILLDKEENKNLFFNGYKITTNMQ